MSFAEKKKYGSMEKAFQAGLKKEGMTTRALSKPFIIKKEDFANTDFNTLLASGEGKRLWATLTFTDGGREYLRYRIESLKQEKTIERVTLVGAISVFNSWDGKQDIE